MTTTALIIQTRDRPEMLLQTVESAINQITPFSRIVVSENSSSDANRRITLDALQPYLERHLDRLFIALAPRSLSHEHSAYIFEHLLGDEDYAVIFHDDDLMEPTFHAALRKVLDENIDVVAASCNARILLGQDLTNRRTMGAWSGTIEIGSPAEMLAAYMDFCSVGPPPLCGYLHRTEILKQLSFSPVNGGKYSDVAALTQLSAKGKIVWLSKAHIQYRIHDGQHSHKVSTRDYRVLVNYLLNNEWLPATSPLFESYRFKHMRLKLLTMDKNTKKRSIMLVRIYLLRSIFFKYILKSGFHLHIIRRLFRR